MNAELAGEGVADSGFTTGVSLARAVDRAGLDPATFAPVIGLTPALLADAWGRLHESQIRRVAGPLALDRTSAPVAPALSQAIWSRLMLVPPLCADSAVSRRLLSWQPRFLFLFLQQLAVGHLAAMNRAGMPVMIRNRLWELRSAEAMRLLNDAAVAGPGSAMVVAEPFRYWNEFVWCLEAPLGPTRFFEAFGARLAAAVLANEPAEVRATLALRMPCDTGDFLIACHDRSAQIPLPPVPGLVDGVVRDVERQAAARNGA